jgi:hypothetical protein
VQRYLIFNSFGCPNSALYWLIIFAKLLDEESLERTVFQSDVMFKISSTISELKGQSHEKVCGIMTYDGRMGLN